MTSPDAAVTLCVATAAGVFLIALADRLKVPSIALLLTGGILLGPEVLGWVDPGALGHGLETVVTLAVAVILFEGGLTLDVAGFRREPRVIVRMLTLGVIVTWAGTAGAVFFVYGDIGLELAIITGSLVIVTGPTVVSPILRRIGVQPRLHHVLYWEGVLVDAVGVFVAVLCYEWIASSSDQPGLAPLGRFASRFVIGAGIGLVAGLALGWVLRRRWVSREYTNIVVLATALLALGLANSVLAESGILAVIVAGLVVSLQRAPQLKELKRFELELTEVGIGLLFVLLAAKLELRHFASDAVAILTVLFFILFVLRPINILLSTWGQNFNWREKVFLSWLAPRGIVAASMASLFALRLGNLGYDEATHLETLTYAVIGTTVIVQGLSASRIARLLGLKRISRANWLLIGDPTLAVTLHRKLRQAGARSIVIAAHPGGAEKSDAASGADGDEDDIVAIEMDPLNPGSISDPRVADVEAVLALSRDPVLNAEICEAWISVVGPASCYRWAGTGSQELAGSDVAGRPLWLDVPSPAEVVAGMDAGTCSLEAVEVGPPEDARRFGSDLVPLLGVDDGTISVISDGEPLHSESVIVYRRRVPGLYGLVSDAAIFDAHSASLEEVLRSLLEVAARANPGLPVEEHLAEILDREKTMPTTIGSGVAIPHVYDDHCTHSMCYVANVSGGLDVTGPDGEPVRLVFLVISPAGKAQAHLSSLAALARLASDTSFVEVLTRQRTRGRLLSLLRERE